MLSVTRIGQAVFAEYDTSFATANYNFVHRKYAKGALLMEAIVLFCAGPLNEWMQHEANWSRRT